MARLIEPSAEYRDAFLRMAQEWRDSGSDRYARALDDFDEYLRGLARARDEPPPHRVPGATFWLEHESEIVGCVRMRLRLDEALSIEGGHIGYDVRPSARRRGFGTEALRLALPEARRCGIDRVLVTTDDENLPSIRIIEKNGGVFTGTSTSIESGKLIRQYWIESHHRGRGC